MWMWLKLKPTPKGDHIKTDITAYFVNFFMHSPKWYLNGQIYWPLKCDQNLKFIPLSETMSIPVTFMWSSPSNHTLWHFDRTLRNKSQQWIINFFKCFVTSFNKMLITQKFRFKEVLLPFLLVHSSYFSSERKQRNSANSFYILQTSRLPNEEIVKPEKCW